MPAQLKWPASPTPRYAGVRVSTKCGFGGFEKFEQFRRVKIGAGNEGSIGVESARGAEGTGTDNPGCRLYCQSILFQLADRSRDDQIWRSDGSMALV
ncbi:MAG: hypothetical protein AAF067_10885 [Pseudomonadota bacterium]